MTFLTLPPPSPGVVGPAEWQRIGLAQAPDRVVSGLITSVVSGLTLRLSPGTACVGGFTFANTANYDIAVPLFTGAGIRISRLVLRLTFASSGAVDIQPVVISQDFLTVGGTLTPLVQTVGPGSGSTPATYDVLLARWALGPNVGTIVGLTAIGPGPCAARWVKSGVQVPAGQVVGVPNLYQSVDTNGAWRQQPIFGSDAEYFEVAHSGVYAISLDVGFTSAAFSPPVTGWAWARIEGYGLDKLDEFNGDGSNWRAKVDVTTYLPAGSLLHPTIYSPVDNAGTLSCGVSFKVARLT